METITIQKALNGFIISVRVPTKDEPWPTPNTFVACDADEATEFLMALLADDAEDDSEIDSAMVEASV